MSAVHYSISDLSPTPLPHTIAQAVQAMQPPPPEPDAIVVLQSDVKALQAEVQMLSEGLRKAREDTGKMRIDLRSFKILKTMVQNMFSESKFAVRVLARAMKGIVRASLGLSTQEAERIQGYMELVDTTMVEAEEDREAEASSKLNTVFQYQ